MKKIVTLAFAAGVLAGCVSSNHATLVQAEINSTPIDMSFPKLMDKLDRELGEDLLRHQVGAVFITKSNIVKTKDRLESSSLTKTPELMSGAVGVEAVGMNGEFAACFEHSICMYDKDKNNRFDTITHPGSMVDLSADIGYDVEASSTKSTSPTGLTRTLIYQGISDGKLKLKYREFSGTLARPAFDQEFEVDYIKDGVTQFGFKGSRFEVFSASSSQISYRVTAYFN